jgi:dCMP deaminase
MSRPDRDEYFMVMAFAASLRGDCTRRKVGAVIVDTDNRVVITGHNGSPPGGPSCLSGGCPRGLHYKTESTISALMPICKCGALWPCGSAVAPGSSYDTGAGTCIALHAEQNAIVFADPARRRGSTMYVTDDPCDGCDRLIKGVAIARTVTPSSLALEYAYQGKQLEWMHKMIGAFF